MAAKTINKTWNLQAFLDSLVYELDQARETLAIKGVNRPLSYAVKDLSLDLQLFPEYDGDKVKFKTAKPGETGASKVAITLGSITDRQIRETTREPKTEDDISIDEIEEIDVETKKNLKQAGIESIKDIEELERKKIDITKVKGVKTGNYDTLADRLKNLRKSKIQQRQLSVDLEQRKSQPPKVYKIDIKRIEDSAIIKLEGDYFQLVSGQLPVAQLNNQKVKIRSISNHTIELEVLGTQFIPGKNALVIQLDEQTTLKLNIE